MSLTLFEQGTRAVGAPTCPRHVLLVGVDGAVAGGAQEPSDFAWTIVSVSDGECALEALRDVRTDAIVTAATLPDMDGATLLQRALDSQPTVVRILLTHGYSIDEAVRAVPVAQRTLPAPCPAPVLLEAVERAVLLRDLLSDERLRAVVGRVQRLPARPRAYFRLMSVLADPDSTIEAAVGAIQSDAALATRVLQLANSSFFGLSRPTSSVEKAVRYLGFNTLQGLVGHCEMFDPLVEEEEEGLERFAHGITTAEMTVAIRADRAHSEESFTAGLLHDLGSLVLASAGARPALEHDAGASHVGAYLLGLWGIPTPIVEAVAYHDQPWLLASPRFELADFVYCACRLARGDSGIVPSSEAEAKYVAAHDIERRFDEWQEVAATIRETRAT